MRSAPRPITPGITTAACEVYSAVARLILANWGEEKSACAKLEKALRTCQSQGDASSRAWTLRHAFDAIQGNAPSGYQDMGGRTVLSRPLSALLASFFLAICWVGPVFLGAGVDSPPADVAERLRQSLGLMLAPLFLSVAVGVPCGMIIRSYRGWIFVLLIALGAPLFLAVGGLLIGRPQPWEISSFLSAAGIMALIAYAIALPLKFLMWFGGAYNN